MIFDYILFQQKYNRTMDPAGCADSKRPEFRSEMQELFAPKVPDALNLSGECPQYLCDTVKGRINIKILGDCCLKNNTLEIVG
ncbi:MAG: hypothetical protein MR272_03690 [Pseudoflavonifractor sp.]|nr:hypothetical protein [Pseudoflavonifractor sp.]MDY3018807.1 hypothetical protein [Oscillospiraceae bacterium]